MSETDEIPASSDSQDTIDWHDSTSTNLSIYADGIGGIIARGGVIRISFYNDLPDPANERAKRIVTGNLIISLPNFIEMMDFLTRDVGRMLAERADKAAGK